MFNSGLNLLRFGEKILNQVKKKIDICEVYLRNTVSLVYRLEGNREYLQRIQEQGLSFRGVQNGKAAFSSVDSLDQSTIDRSLNLLRMSLRTGKPWRGSLPEQEQLPSVSELCDLSIMNLTPKDVLKFFKNELKDLHRKKEVGSLFTSATLMFHDIAITNSLGLQHEQKLTRLMAHVRFSYMQRGRVNSIYLEVVANTLKQFKLGEVLSASINERFKDLPSRTLKSSTRLPIILGPRAVEKIVASPIGKGAAIGNYYQKDSILSGKVGRQVASKLLTVIDDGTLAGGFNSSLFDADGVARKKTMIVNRGILANFISDACTANRYNRQSTGNAIRDVFWSHRIAPVTSPTNLVIECDRGSVDDLAQEIKRGVLIFDLQEPAHFTTSDYLSPAEDCYQVSNGEIRCSLQHVALAVDLLDFFRNIDAIGDDTERLNTVIAPSIRFKEGTIVPFRPW